MFEREYSRKIKCYRNKKKGKLYHPFTSINVLLLSFTASAHLVVFKKLFVLEKKRKKCYNYFMKVEKKKKT